jgi:hypothetical protein
MNLKTASPWARRWRRHGAVEQWPPAERLVQLDRDGRQDTESVDRGWKAAFRPRSEVRSKTVCGVLVLDVDHWNGSTMIEAPCGHAHPPEPETDGAAAAAAAPALDRGLRLEADAGD